MAKILIVEDTPDNMKLFRAILRRHGHDVIELVDGERLLVVAEEAQPDLVLLDIQLPGRDGYELLADLRNRGGRPLKVVALTAHAYDSDRARALEAGFDGYITKPIDIHEFPEQLKTYL
jgi:two-component system cell cycle response regulator DivK